MQYARALLARAEDEFHFRFLIQPKFRAFPAAAPGADIVAARLSAAGCFMRLFSRRYSRRVSGEAGHCLRHALHRNFHTPHKRDDAPFVLTIHDMHFLHAPKPERVLTQLQHSIRAARAVVFISKSAQSAAAEQLDFSGKTLRVIHNGVEKPAVGHRPAWFNGVRPFLLSVATVTQHKNHIVLPDMMHHLPEYDLVIAGKKKPGVSDAVQQKARDAGVAGRLMMPGVVSDAEKAWLLAHCAGFVFPSLREGFGMPVVEALHFGKPAFCFKNTSLPEVGGEVACYWAHSEPQHMAEAVCANLPPNPQACQQRRDWAAQFSWGRNAAAHLTLYREILSA